MDIRSLGEHIVHSYDDELEALRARVLRLGGVVEKQLDGALRALRDQDLGLADQVVEGDSAVNTMEREIDEECNRLLARRAPVAGDLRLVLGVVKTVTDLERMGDESVRIARMASQMVSRSGGEARVTHLRELGPRVQAMLHSALHAFARMDLETAAQVVGEDSSVDRAYESLSRELITRMMEDGRVIPASLDVMFAARALERIGDRACNICEYVIYIVKGADVRHTSVATVQGTARSVE